VTVAGSPIGVAGGCSVLSKSRSLKPEGLPYYFVRGAGCQVFDAQGNAYVDWEAGLLSILYGHGDSTAEEASRRAMRDGLTSLPLGTVYEQSVAERLLALTRFDSGQVRFTATGSSACSAAVRVARAITGRETVLSIGYHGIDDWALAHTPPAWGVPSSAKDGVVALAFNNLDWTDAHEPPAAVIVEPVTSELPDDGYLSELRGYCDRVGAALIFDEAITAGRYPTFTAARWYEVQPDLLITSKCLANGLPLAAVIGDRKWMRSFDLNFRPDWADQGRGPVYVSGTYHCPGVSLAVADACLDRWERDHVGQEIWQSGRFLSERLTKAVADAGMAEHVQIKGPPYRLILHCPDPALRTLILREMLDQGHIIGAGWNHMLAHNNHYRGDTIRAFAKVLTVARMALETGRVNELAGRIVAEPYRQA
jgi:glutamate-1-semialdehyde 2,1-aminomutase